MDELVRNYNMTEKIHDNPFVTHMRHQSIAETVEKLKNEK